MHCTCTGTVAQYRVVICDMQAPAPTDDAFMTDSDPDEESAADLEAEFEAEKNSRSLASLFGGEENVIKIDAEYQDDALKVCSQHDLTNPISPTCTCMVAFQDCNRGHCLCFGKP